MGAGRHPAGFPTLSNYKSGKDFFSNGLLLEEFSVSSRSGGDDISLGASRLWASDNSSQ